MSTQPTSPETQVDMLLSRFPGPIFLSRGPKDELPSGLLIIPPILTACFFLINVVEGYSVLGWAVVLLFSLLTIVTGIWFRNPPREAPHLTLSANGFRQSTGRLAGQSLWVDCSDFVVSPINSPYGQKLPAIRFRDRRGEDTWFGRINLMMTPYNGLMGPVDGLSIEQLADLMTKWRERALSRDPQPVERMSGA